MIPLHLDSLDSLARKIEKGAVEYINLHAELVRQGYTENDISYTYSNTSGISLIGFFEMDLDKEEFLHRIRDIQIAIAETYHNGIEISFWLKENTHCKWVGTGEFETKEKMKVMCE
jgi:hypothetical protein